MSHLYDRNTPESLWKFNCPLTSADWTTLIADCASAFPWVAKVHETAGWDGLNEYVLGEGQFGERRWHQGSLNRVYYSLRPFVPSPVKPFLRRLVRVKRKKFALGWPIEDRYIQFLDALRVGIQSRFPNAHPAPFWPNRAGFGLVLTHDIETSRGRDFVCALADLEESLGFRSSFNFVPEGYSIDLNVLDKLKKRGFEIGVHGLKHDGKLFSSRAEFDRRAKKINDYLETWQAVGFRAPFTHRQPVWMQALHIEYDSSFFDTDPFETIPGGTMTIWPFFCGHFVELPYTLPQDHTLLERYGPKTLDIWLSKIDFISKWGGMALVNVHPDYMRDPAGLAVYRKFLQELSRRLAQNLGSGQPAFWHALPRDVARWWRERTGN